MPGQDFARVLLAEPDCSDALGNVVMQPAGDLSGFQLIQRYLIEQFVLLGTCHHLLRDKRLEVENKLHTSLPPHSPPPLTMLPCTCDSLTDAWSSVNCVIPALSHDASSPVFHL
ncbi:hypothetical protein P7K49_026729, partial [Saguinus oedipus]